MAQSALPTPRPPHDPACRRIQVSREKRPLNFFVTLCKKRLTTDDVVELSGLGLAVTTVVTIAEILRSEGYVSLEHIQTSLVEPHPDGHTTAPKAKIQIWIRKTPQFDSLMTNHNSHHSRPQNLPASATASAASTTPEAPAPTTAQLEAGNTNPASTAPPPDPDVGTETQPPATDEPASVPQTALQSKS